MVEWSKIAEIAIPIGIGLFVLALVIGGGVPGVEGRRVAISNIKVE